jgi:hypothetical protein
VKQFWLFTWDSYYPCGPLEDFEKDFDAVEECFEYLTIKGHKSCYGAILDMYNRKWIKVPDDLLRSSYR